jgi:hypothetical protein
MSGNLPDQVPNVEAVRQRAIDVLMEHFSRDTIDLAGFERRLDRVNRCSTSAELREILRELPSLEPSKPGSRPPTSPAQGGGPVVVDADRVRENGFLISVLGGTNRAGRWIPARNNYAIGVLGGLSLDFRESLFGPGVTELNVMAVLSGVEIIVPPEMAVEVDGMSLLGGFEHQTDTPLRHDPKQPTLRIRGLAFLGGVDVKVQLPGETSRQAKRRRRLERKAKVRGLLGRTDD